MDEAVAARVSAHSFGFFSSIEETVQDRFVIDPALSTGFAMWAGHESGVEPSFTLAVSAYRLGRHQRADGHWPTFDGRPPSSYSLFASTAIGARAMSLYMPASLQAELRTRTASARSWLASTPAKSNEDATFRLLGLVWTGASAQERIEAATALLQRQNADGGWGQLPGDSSDAYATGQAVYALGQAGLPDHTASARGRGVDYLVSTQKPDGSWHVRTRIHAKIPVSPPYFESGFPYGKDQYISCSATSWALMALAESLPRRAGAPGPRPVLEARPRGLATWMETAVFGTADELAKALDSGLDPNAKSALGTTLLMFSAHDPAKLRLLLSRGAVAAARDQAGFDALMIASLYQGNAGSVQALLAAGASPNPPSSVRYRTNPLVLASIAGDAQMVEALLRRGANPEAPMLLVGFVRVKPADVSAGYEYLDVTEALVRHGVKPDGAKPGEPSLLAVSAVNHKSLSVRQLITLGADPNRKDRTGSTALDHALSIRYAPESTAEALRGPSRASR